MPPIGVHKQIFLKFDIFRFSSKWSLSVTMYITMINNFSRLWGKGCATDNKKNKYMYIFE